MEGLDCIQEIGVNAQKIISRLLENQNLCKLLKYADTDPLSHSYIEDTKKEIYGKHIRIVPKVATSTDENIFIGMMFDKGVEDYLNQDFLIIHFAFEIFVPMTSWTILNDNLRPFLIMSEINKSLNNKTINGLGKIKGGNFNINFLTNEQTSYIIRYRIIQND